MFKPLYNLLLALLLLTAFCGQSVQAQTKVYQYDGKLPFVQMMLNMMVAMGILDRLPANGAYGGHSSSSPWGSQLNPYSRALAMQGMSSNPLADTPWGNPGWGMLPVDSYTRNYSNYDQTRYSSAGSSTELDGWVNEPWDSSVWNENARVPAASLPQTQNLPPVQQTAPLVQNFNYNVTPNASNQTSQAPRARASQPRQSKQSPLAKLAQPAAPVNRVNRQATRQQNNRQSKPSPLRKKLKQKPCVTEFCGLKKPSLNGLWVAKNGEMLGVKNHRYLWSDSSSRYLTGQLKVQNEYLLANVDGYENKLMRFKYKLAGNHLLTMQPDGKTREFVRVPTGQHSSARRYYQ